MPDPFLTTNAVEDMWRTQKEMGYLPRRNPEGKFSLLTITSKMMAFSFGLPYEQSCPGRDASLREERGICKLCYASRGNYAFPHMRTTLGRRREITRDPERFVETMLKALADPWRHSRLSSTYPKEFTRLLRRTLPGRFFRIHDSGDFWSPHYVRAWKAICAERPDLTFWAPTRAWAAPAIWTSPVDGKTYTRRELLSALADLSSLPNVTLRPSMLAFDLYPWSPEQARRQAGGAVRWAAASGALTIVRFRVTIRGEEFTFSPVVGDNEIREKGGHLWWRDAFVCPMSMHESVLFNCQTAKGPDGRTPCRVCWTNPELRVVYPMH